MAELGAIASIVGIAAAGAQLSMVLFEFGSTVGSARSEVNQIATEISQFCAVLKQLHSTLTKAKARRYSISAIATTQDILKRCQEIFKEIEDIVQPLQRSTGKSKEPTVELIARVKWTFKRSKVQVLQKTLESSKNTLQVMLLVLDLAQRTASPRVSTIAEQLEDEQEQAVIQGLIAAHRCTVDQIETLENEAEEQDPEQVASAPGAQSTEAQVFQIRTGNGERVSDVGAQERGMKEKRASVWVSDLIFNKSPLPSGFRRNTWGDPMSSPTIASQARYLVHAWTHQATEVPENSGQNQVKNSDFSMEGYEEGYGEKSEPPPKPLDQPQNLEKLQDVFHVMAMYDYEADNRTSLSFHKGDIIQVLSQLDSGWWHGVIHGVRGWFPSNYTRIWLVGKSHDNSQISDEESEYEEPDYEDLYEDSDSEENDGIQTDGLGKELILRPDFWIPQANFEGKLFYFNTETGESSKDLGELKIYFDDETPLLVRNVQSLVSLIRSEAGILATSIYINAVFDIVNAFVSSTTHSTTWLAGNESFKTQSKPILEKLVSLRQHLLDAGEKGRAIANEGSADGGGERTWRQWSHSLPPMVFEVVKEAKELVLIVDLFTGS